MEMVIDLLQHQAAYQEVLALLLEHEWKGLQGLKSTLEKVAKHVDSEKVTERKLEARSNQVSESKSKLSRKTVQPEDKHLVTLQKLLSNSGIYRLNKSSSFLNSVLKCCSCFRSRSMHVDNR